MQKWLEIRISKEFRVKNAVLKTGKIKRKLRFFGIKARQTHGLGDVQRLVCHYALALLAILSVLMVMGLKQADAASLPEKSNYAIDTMLVLASVPTVTAREILNQSYPPLFQTDEIASQDLSAFTKFSEVMSRFKKDVRNDELPHYKAWFENVAHLQDAPLATQLRQVNSLINMISYKEDKDVWGVADYWATPEEFFAKGAGDCEDFAIAKYITLKALGVSEKQMRLSIVHDTVKDIPHAILVVYDGADAFVLDNQLKQVTHMADIDHYRPYYSISRLAWWRHKPADTARF